MEYHKTAKWKSLRAKCLRRDRRKCQRCRQRQDLTAHHIWPREYGGTDDLSNLITLCEECHDLVEPAEDEVFAVWAIMMMDNPHQKHRDFERIPTGWREKVRQHYPYTAKTSHPRHPFGQKACRVQEWFGWPLYWGE